ncbi:MAG: S8 family serine peptidase [Thermoplasmata archaeon]|nr:S8 family serine peptidase [Thermoplasmata archaeon]
MRTGAVAFGVVLVVGAVLLLPAFAPAFPTGPGASPRRIVASDAAMFVSNLAAHALPSQARLELTVSLEPRDATGLFARDGALARSGSSQYLTESQFEHDYAPSSTNVTALEQYFSTFGAAGYALTPDRLSLRFSLSSQAAGEAFATTLMGQTSSAGADWTWTTMPTLPASLANSVYGIGGLARSPTVPTLALRPAPSAPVRSELNSYVVDGNETGVDWFTGSDYVQAYGEAGLFPGGTGAGSNASYATGEAVATILMSGYNDTAKVDLPPWDPAQIHDYFNDTFPASWPVPLYLGVPVTIANVTPPSPGAYGTLQDDSLDEAENSLDIEMAGSAAPGATVANFYFSAGLFQNLSSNAPLGPVADDFAQALSDALSYNYTGAHLASVTNSYGLPDLNDSLWNLELAHAAAIGVTVVAASGDQGDAPNDVSGHFQGQWPTWPASAAFNGSGTVSVGGVSLALGGTPTGTYTGGVLPDGFDSNFTGFASQTAWYDDLGGYGHVEGSEGGLSTVIPEPYWQFDSAAQPAIASAGGVQGASMLGRAGPDVAFAANDTVAYVAHNATGSFFTVLEGTSIAAPFFAGLLAEWSAVDHRSFGWLDPTLYRMAGYYDASPQSSNPFLDVTNGSNFVFSAGLGWDAATGWGGIDPVRFLPAFAAVIASNFSYSGPTPGLPPGLFTPAPTTPLVTFVVVALGITLALTLVAVIVWDERARRRRTPPSGPYQVPTWAYGAPPPGTVQYGGAAPPPASPYPMPPSAPGSGPYAPPPPGWGAHDPPATFACPYCGALRPAEPVRCPGCGAF